MRITAPNTMLTKARATKSRTVARIIGPTQLGRISPRSRFHNAATKPDIAFVYRP
jgi:hypothetical protein